MNSTLQIVAAFLKGKSIELTSEMIQKADESALQACTGWIIRATPKMLTTALERPVKSYDEMTDEDMAKMAARFSRGQRTEQAIYHLLGKGTTADAFITVHDNPMQHIIAHNWWDIEINQGHPNAAKIDVKLLGDVDPDEVEKGVIFDRTTVSWSRFSKVSTPYFASLPVAVLACTLDDNVVKPAMLLSQGAFRGALRVSKLEEHYFEAQGKLVSWLLDSNPKSDFKTVILARAGHTKRFHDDGLWDLTPDNFFIT